jgi:hypothetical protein
MKKMSKITTLLLTLITVLMMSQAAFAESTPVNGGTYTFNGSAIVTSGVTSLEASLKGLEPGDSITITQTYVNSSDEETEWYIRNEILDTLESSKDMNGGYTYKLVSGGQTLFDSEAVGGRDSESDEQGLKQLNDAITGENAGEKWIHIDTLKSGAKGTTTLTVALDGESQANIYQGTNGKLDIQYAVEETAKEGETIYKTKAVDTGDTTSLILPIAAFLGAAVLLVLAIMSYRKDRKDGEEA